jgi:ribosome-associated heat shock protein Hsp15
MASTEPVRIDQWLWAARFAKTRSAATELVRGGRVEVNERAVKPSAPVGPGDTVELTLGPVKRTLIVQATAVRRGSATAAAELYEETPESRAAGGRHREERRLAVVPFPEHGGRPTKRDRRRLDAARRRSQGRG